MRIPSAPSWSVVLLAGLSACSSGGSPGGFTPNDDSGTGPASGSSSGSGASSGGSSGSGSGGVPVLGGNGPDGSTAPGTTACNVTNPNGDMDMDGWTPAQGDCNDCDPNVNPGAIDVLHSNDGGTPTWGDEDCDGKAGDSAMPCDTGLALTDVDPNDAAKALELCVQTTEASRKYGVISAAYVRADGTAQASPGLQVGIESAFGSNVNVQGGANMLVLSSGHARTAGQSGSCNGISCETNPCPTAGYTCTPPAGFPEDDPACPPTPTISDDIALEVQVRVPSNATGYSFNFKFYSFEYPDFVCDTKGYNDQFIALVTPAPAGAYPTGAASGNISFDSNGHPVSVNLGFFDVCDPAGQARFASSCKSTSGASCPTIPNPYCPMGLGELAGTGFDVWRTAKDGGAPLTAGATRWLETQAPATPGSILTIRFAIWDAGNAEYDSTVLVDNIQWVANGGTIAVGTQPVPTPK